MGVGFRWRKSKGSKAERDLMHLFWENGFAAMRAAGSGSTQHPSADVVAGNGKLYFAIEIMLYSYISYNVEFIDFIFSVSIFMISLSYVIRPFTSTSTSVVCV